jgi:membrane fusion protein, peptide pheromone/bacteriocin exporter
MSENIFPKEIIENSQEANFSKHSVKSRVIYTVIVLSLICSAGVLPFIYVDVAVRSQGLIRPVTEVVQIAAPVSGNIQSLLVTENSTLSRGELFAIIEAPDITERLRFNSVRTNQLHSFLADLSILQGEDIPEKLNSGELQSPRYQRAFLEYRQLLLNQQQRVDQAGRKLEREKILFERELVSEAQMDEALFVWQDAVNNYRLLKEQHQNQWNLDEITFRDELNQLKSEKILLEKELSRYEIRSPITGTVQNLNGIFQSSFVHANQALGDISPDTSLIAEVYVTTGDIGLLREGMHVRMQIDAYNHHDWGVATGQIKSISTDVMINEGQPLFRVRCSIDQAYLELKNGFRGEIKKGMTFQARFIVSRRSLFQLLYDKVDDWLNPSWGENEYVSLKESGRP